MLMLIHKNKIIILSIIIFLSCSFTSSYNYSTKSFQISSITHIKPTIFNHSTTISRQQSILPVNNYKIINITNNKILYYECNSVNNSNICRYKKIIPQISITLPITIEIFCNKNKYIIANIINSQIHSINGQCIDKKLRLYIKNSTINTINSLNIVNISHRINNNLINNNLIDNNLIDNNLIDNNLIDNNEYLFIHNSNIKNIINSNIYFVSDSIIIYISNSTIHNIYHSKLIYIYNSTISHGTNNDIKICKISNIIFMSNSNIKHAYNSHINWLINVNIGTFDNVNGNIISKSHFYIIRNSIFNTIEISNSNCIYLAHIKHTIYKLIIINSQINNIISYSKSSKNSHKYDCYHINNIYNSNINIIKNLVIFNITNSSIINIKNTYVRLLSLSVIEYIYETSQIGDNNIKFYSNNYGIINCKINIIENSIGFIISNIIYYNRNIKNEFIITLLFNSTLFIYNDIQNNFDDRIIVSHDSVLIINK